MRDDCRDLPHIYVHFFPIYKPKLKFSSTLSSKQNKNILLCIIKFKHSNFNSKNWNLFSKRSSNNSCLFYLMYKEVQTSCTQRDRIFSMTSLSFACLPCFTWKARIKETQHPLGFWIWNQLWLMIISKK